MSEHEELEVTKRLIASSEAHIAVSKALMMNAVVAGLLIGASWILEDRLAAMLLRMFALGAGASGFAVSHVQDRRLRPRQ